MYEQSENNIMACNTNEDTMDVVWNQCRNLASAIIVSNELVEGVSSFTRYSEAEVLQLAEQFAQAAGVFMACVLVAEEKNKDAAVIEMYKSHQQVFTQYSQKAGRLSGRFTTEEGLVEYFEGLASSTIDRLNYYRIEPTRLHDAAMQTVEDRREEKSETKPWGATIH